MGAGHGPVKLGTERGQEERIQPSKRVSYINESRAETHERFYIIEVHRHRFEMSARKVPFEKCTRWRKVCGRSAKDQIGDSIYSFFFRFRAKGSRKARERCAKDVSSRAMSCPKWAAFSHAWFWSKGKEATYHNDILVASIHSCKQQPICCIVCIRVCLITYIWFLIRILDFGKCNPYGTAKGGERFAKDLRKGGSWELLFSTTPKYMCIYIYWYIYFDGHNLANQLIWCPSTASSTLGFQRKGAMGAVVGGSLPQTSQTNIYHMMVQEYPLANQTKCYWLVVSNIFYFHPYLGKIPILTNIFQRGWNHQLGYFLT